MPTFEERENKGAISIHVPYHRAEITPEDIESVVKVLQSGWLTTGPKCAEFEFAFARHKGGGHAVAVNSCTSALVLCLKVLDMKPGDEVITSPITFVATANSILHAGGKPVFADISAGTMNIDPSAIERAITPQTKAIMPVHVGGNPCDMWAIGEIAKRHGIPVIEDCAHAIEGSFEGRQLGTLGLCSAFSFYPTKNITTGEGGMVFTADPKLAHRIRLLSRHGLDKSTYQRMELEGSPLYDVVEPGFKMNMSDLQAALGLSQFMRLEDMYRRRLEVKARYDAAFSGHPAFQTIAIHPNGTPALHLYQLLIETETLKISRDELVRIARDRGVELSVNYVPVHMFSWYRKAFGFKPGDFPESETAGSTNISLPFYPQLSDEEIDHVIEVLTQISVEFAR